MVEYRFELSRYTKQGTKLTLRNPEQCDVQCFMLKTHDSSLQHDPIQFLFIQIVILEEEKLVSTWIVFSVGVSAEMINGIKKEVFGKEPPRIWMNEDVKMQPFSHSMVTIIILI